MDCDDEPFVATRNAMILDGKSKQIQPHRLETTYAYDTVTETCKTYFLKHWPNTLFNQYKAAISVSPKQKFYWSHTVPYWLTRGVNPHIDHYR